MEMGWREVLPFWSCSRHSKVISKVYLSVNLAGLFRTLTPRRETTDMLAVVGGQLWELGIESRSKGTGEALRGEMIVEERRFGRKPNSAKTRRVDGQEEGRCWGRRKKVVEVAALFVLGAAV